MNVAIQRIRDYLLTEECRLAPRQLMEPDQSALSRPKKRVTIRSKYQIRTVNFFY